MGANILDNEVVNLVGANPIVQRNGRIPFVQNIVQRQVLPNIKKGMQQQAENIKDAEVYSTGSSTYKVSQEFPLTLKISEAEQYTFPYEPILSISGGVAIAKRSVSKGKVGGTVKERWAMQDWDISISGQLIGDDGNYPANEILKMRKFLEAPVALTVINEIMQQYGIYNVVIETFSFPFTKGEHRQTYEIKAVSDNDIPLFVKL